VTVSIGVATAPEGEDGLVWRTLFDTADLHLFSAKRGGRNLVRGHGPHPPQADGAPAPEPPDAA
jgi:PleD family two-component response regulator